MTAKDAVEANRDDGQSRRAGGALARNNLVAIGTAAVLTIYSAGYARTRDAAQRFAEADQAVHRPIAPVIAAAGSPVVVEAASPAPAAPTQSASADTGRIEEHEVAVSTAPPKAPASPPTVAAVDTPVVSETSPDSSLAAEPVTSPVSHSTDTSSATSAADSVSKQPKWRDGEYYGWGTSRHGDIQAGIEIKGGRITAAWVQQCLTRYSCNWIAALPGQVLARQSAEVDYVSGATQSTNAFYYAVVEALARAK